MYANTFPQLLSFYSVYFQFTSEDAILDSSKNREKAPSVNTDESENRGCRIKLPLNTFRATQLRTLSGAETARAQLEARCGLLCDKEKPLQSRFRGGPSVFMGFISKFH